MRRHLLRGRAELLDSVCIKKRSNELFTVVQARAEEEEGRSSRLSADMNGAFAWAAVCMQQLLATRRIQNVLNFLLLRRKRKREWGSYGAGGLFLFLLFILLQSHEWEGSWQTEWRSGVCVCRVQSDLLSFMHYSHSILRRAVCFNEDMDSLERVLTDHTETVLATHCLLMACLQLLFKWYRPLGPEAENKSCMYKSCVHASGLHPFFSILAPIWIQVMLVAVTVTSFTSATSSWSSWLIPRCSYTQRVLRPCFPPRWVCIECLYREASSRHPDPDQMLNLLS